MSDVTKPKLADRVAYWLGFKRMAFVNYDPPSSLYKDLGDGNWQRPPGVTKLEVVVVPDFRSRLRLLVSGKMQVIACIWWDEVPPRAAGDVVRWEVLPPHDKVDPKLRV